MHRDEAIYARSDARAGITLTAEEASELAALVGLAARQAEASVHRGFSEQDAAHQRRRADRLRALAARLTAASTTPSP